MDITVVKHPGGTEFHVRTGSHTHLYLLSRYPETVPAPAVTDEDTTEDTPVEDSVEDVEVSE